MATRLQFQEMAESKIFEAEVLLVNGLDDGAFYLCGYAVEFALKAAICNRMGIEMFENVAIVRDISKSFKIHRLNDLVILASLWPIFEESKSADQGLNGAWSLISGWSEQKRYDNGCDHDTANDFIEAVKVFMIWIRNYW